MAHRVFGCLNPPSVQGQCPVLRSDVGLQQYLLVRLDFRGERWSDLFVLETSACLVRFPST